MVRVKKSKKNVLIRNRKNIAKRYCVQPLDIVETEIDYDRHEESEVMSLDQNNSVGNPDITDNVRDDLSSNNITEKHERPTGFSLYDSYKPNVAIDQNAPNYIFVDANRLISFLAQFPCTSCFNFALRVSQLEPKGYAHFLKIECSNCGVVEIFNTSGQLGKSHGNSTRPSFDVNRRMVQGFSSIGKGHRGMESFSMSMNMKPMTSKAYNGHLKTIHSLYSEFTKESLEKSRTEVRKAYCDINNTPLDEPGPINISVSYDGSWQKRGFTSKNGVGCCVEVVTGLVIDFEVLSKYCRLCEVKKMKFGQNSVEFEEWFTQHETNCQKNFDGSSPAMEMEAAERIWLRSEKQGFRYTTLVSDGDSKTFSHLTGLNPYPDYEIEKVECVNHVEKRLGTGLRKIVADNTGTGNPLGGKKFGSLKASTIDKLTKYYRNAIQSNLGDVEKMKNSVFATLSHCSSTDTKPNHTKCPTGEDSWCFYNRALAKKETPESHGKMIKTPLNQTVLGKILPLYQRLGSVALLSKCVTGKTQNANEALHGVIWTKCPKTTFASRTTLEIGVCEAISQYNTGCLQSVSDLQRIVGSSPGTATAKIAKSFDAKRLKLSKTRKHIKYNEYKRKQKQAQLLEEEKKKEKEGLTYGAGEF